MRVFLNKKMRIPNRGSPLNNSVGPEGLRGFSPFHLKPKAHTKEEEVPGDK